MNNDQSKREYIARINKVIDYIDENIDNKLSLEKLASLAGFSKYHFHRIFKAMIGENLNEYIKRVRLEKALILLKNFTDYSITDIGLELGFLSTANFSATFKDYYGITPSNFKRNKDISLVNKPMPSGKLRVLNSNSHLDQNKKIRIETLPDYNIIYVRHIGSYFKAGVAWEELMGFVHEESVRDEDYLMIGISHNDPQITAEENLRYDACITVDSPVKENNKIGTAIIKGGLFGIHEFYDKPTEIINAYDYIYNIWLPISRYLPDDKSCFEIYKSPTDEIQEEKVSIDICIPLRRI